MTRPIPGTELAEGIRARFPEAVAEANERDVLLKSESLLEVCQFLRDESSLAFDFLAHLTSVDCIDYFEVVYQITSMRHNHKAVLKARAYEREEPTMPSTVSVWRGADFQEREVFDLMGVRFDGHPNMKRILLWDGFPGHPLRKDFLLQRP